MMAHISSRRIAEKAKIYRVLEGKSCLFSLKRFVSVHNIIKAGRKTVRIPGKLNSNRGNGAAGRKLYDSLFQGAINRENSYFFAKK